MTELTRWVVVDDTDNRIGYSGGWSTATGNTNQYNSQGNFGDVYDNTLRTTTRSSSKLTFAFTGNAASIYGTNDVAIDSATKLSDPDWDCIVDGQVSSSAKTSPFQYKENNWTFCNFRQLSNARHIIELNVRTKGRAFWFDKLHYRPSNVVENEKVLVTRDDADLEYSNGWGSLAEVAYFNGRKGATIRFPFDGAGLGLWAMVPTELPRGASQGVYSIDGGEDVPFEIPGVGGVSEYNRRIFETPQLPQGRHVIVITYQGGSDVTPLVLGNLIVTRGTNRRAVQLTASLPPAPTASDPPSGNTVGDGTESGEPTGRTGNGGPVGNGDSSSSSGSSSPIQTGDIVPGLDAEDPTNNNSRIIFVKPSSSTLSPESTGTVGTSLEGGNNDVSAAKTTNNTGAIVGGILGALALFLIVIATAVFLRQRRSRNRIHTHIDAFDPTHLTAGGHGHNGNTQPYGSTMDAPAMSYSSSSAYSFPSQGGAPQQNVSSTGISHGVSSDHSHQRTPSTTLTSPSSFVMNGPGSATGDSGVHGHYQPNWEQYQQPQYQKQPLAPQGNPFSDDEAPPPIYKY